MGQFAQQALPLTDSVKLTIVRVNSTKIETVTVSLSRCIVASAEYLRYYVQLPYRSRFGAASVAFNDSASFRVNNCVAGNGTNGINLYESTTGFRLSAKEERKQFMNVLMDDIRQENVVLPPELVPKNPLEGSRSVVQFHLLDDKKTGVLALGRLRQ